MAGATIYVPPFIDFPPFLEHTPMAVWINEFHYDNTGSDAGEFIEIAGTAGTDLTGWSLVLYNGNPTQLTSYGTTALTGSINNQQGGFGTVLVTFASNGIQNGNTTGTEADGIALVDNTGAVVQFLSYEGALTAADGPAAGQTSTDIGIFQTGAEPIGSSLALVGEGATYADFTWAAASDDTPGAVNVSQTFLGGATEDVVAIGDASITEGDAGTAVLTFTVTRSGNATSFTVDFATADGSATAGSDYVAASGTLAFTAGGALSETVSVTINGDTLAETDETFTVGLTNLVGTAVIGDASATGTIVNDELVFTEIAAIQGAGHRAPLVGGTPASSSANSGALRVNVEGVVTAIATNGFYIQDPTPDADIATSDGIFVFTSSAPPATLTVGETVRVLGARVDEFRAASNNLSVTQLNATQTGASIVELGGNTAIEAVLIGEDGRLPPNVAIDDDGLASFDPTTDAIDFWESLEGMKVELYRPTAISQTLEFRTRDPANSSNAEGPPNEEIWVQVPGSFDPEGQSTGRSPLLGETDPNPERIQIDDLRPAIDLPDVSVGARFLGNITGVVNYDFQNFEVLVTETPTAVPLAERPEPVTRLSGTDRVLTVATYNVENLDAEVEDTDAALANSTGGVSGNDLYTRLGNSDDDVGTGKFAAHARQIAINLDAPAIVALQEVQDNDGAEISADVDAARTLQTLVDIIFDTYGIVYEFAYANPETGNIDGGQPNANIRPAYLYRPDLVSLVDNTPEETTEVRRLVDPNPEEADGFAGDDFAESRKPVEARFLFNGEVVTLINVHLNSKGGDNALFGNVQPPVFASELQRIEQARIINARVGDLLAEDADAKVIVLGDFNDFAWTAPLLTIDGSADGDQVLTNLVEALLPENARWSYNFQGAAQSLDHITASDSLLGLNARVEVVHVNVGQADGASDHDPIVALFDFRGSDETLAGTATGEAILGYGGDDALEGLGGEDTMLGSLGNDLIDGGEGADRLNGGDGADTILGGTGADRAGGAAGNDLLMGGAENDVLLGGEGDDTLVGGEGRDQLGGGAGADLFVFDGLGSEAVRDFNAAFDMIGLSAAAFDPTLALGALDTSRFEANTTGQASMAGGVFVFETDTSVLWWDMDGTAAGRTGLGILLGVNSLDITDLVVVA
jgi:hypothetical protein